MHERYSIEVSDEVVEIYGELTIEETFDFLSFFEKKGYKSVILGSENSTLRMLKRDPEEFIHDQFILTLKETIKEFQEKYEEEKQSHEETKEKILYTENLLKSLMTEEYEKYKKLNIENQNLKKIASIELMENNPEVQEILKNLDSEFFGSEYFRPLSQCQDLDWSFGKGKNISIKEEKMEPIPNCCLTQEKQEQYDKLLKLKNDFPYI